MNRSVLISEIERAINQAAEARRRAEIGYSRCHYIAKSLRKGAEAEAAKNKLTAETYDEIRVALEALLETKQGDE